MRGSLGIWPRLRRRLLSAEDFSLSTKSQGAHLNEDSPLRAPRTARCDDHDTQLSAVGGTTAQRPGVMSSASASTTKNTLLTDAMRRDAATEPHMRRGSRARPMCLPGAELWTRPRRERAQAAGHAAGIAHVCDVERAERGVTETDATMLRLVVVSSLFRLVMFDGASPRGHTSRSAA